MDSTPIIPIIDSTSQIIDLPHIEAIPMEISSRPSIADFDLPNPLTFREGVASIHTPKTPPQLPVDDSIEAHIVLSKKLIATKVLAKLQGADYLMDMKDFKDAMSVLKDLASDSEGKNPNMLEDLQKQFNL